VETLARVIADDPRRFDQLILATLAPSSSEVVDLALRRTVSLLEVDTEIGHAAGRFRGGSLDRLEDWQHLLRALDERGVTTNHSTIAALGTRIFRSGSSPLSDELLADLLKQWETLEVEIGFAVSPRTLSVILARQESTADRIGSISGGDLATGSQMLQSVLNSLLWPSASASRQFAQQISNRFVNDPAPTERTLLRQLLPPADELVDVDIPGWRTLLADALSHWGTARLTSSTNQERLASALRDLAVEPIELSWLLVYPSVDDAVREGGQYSLRIVLQEAPQ